MDQKIAKEYDVVIVGAGPAGLFSAKKLSESGKKVLIVDKGLDIDRRRCVVVEGRRQCTHCTPCHIMYGFGGAGGLSDGKCILSPKSGVNLTTDLYPVTFDEQKIIDTISDIDRTLINCGAPTGLNFDEKRAGALKELATRSGIEYVPTPKKHIGSDLLRTVIRNVKKSLEANGVDILLREEVRDLKVENGILKGLYVNRKKLIRTKYAVLAPGRSGAFWFLEIARKYKLAYSFLPLDIGVRIEIPNELMNHIIEIDYDPKFWIFTDSYEDFARTYCVNPSGFVVKERYVETLGREIFVGVNGHANKYKKSQNTNFALLISNRLTEPLKDMLKYTTSLAYIFYNLGAGKPILQTYGDLKKFRRSKSGSLSKINIRPTLDDVTLGDMSLGFSYRIMKNLIDAIEKLSGVIQGLNTNNTLIYGPEIKFKHIRGKIKKNFETTKVKNLFLAGDGCGLSGGIINAATTGILAAEGILSDE